MQGFTTPYGFSSTASEVVAGVDLSGKRAIVTGGASGIGLETARALAQADTELADARANVRTAAAALAFSTGSIDARCQEPQGCGRSER